MRQFIDTVKLKDAGTMLDTLRRGAGSWIAKIFIGLLVLSFAVWGIADIFRGYGSTNLAKVGDSEISTETYRLAYQNEIRTFSRRLRQQLTNEQARALGLDQRVLALLIGEAAMDAHAKSLNLGITKKAVATEIVNTPALQDSAGAFSQARFQQLLRSTGFSEQGFIEQRRLETIRAQLSGALLSDITPPTTMLSASYNFSEETRKLRYFILPRSAVGKIAEPSEEQLRDYYKSQPVAFTAPEYRKVAFLVLSPKVIKDKIVVKDEEITEAFEARRSTYITPERRQILQITYPDALAAKAAAEKIKNEQDFINAAKARGFEKEDISLGLLSKTQMADTIIAEAAFALEAGKVSKPVTGNLATVLVFVKRWSLKSFANLMM